MSATKANAHLCYLNLFFHDALVKGHSIVFAKVKIQALGEIDMYFVEERIV